MCLFIEDGAPMFDFHLLVDLYCNTYRTITHCGCSIPEHLNTYLRIQSPLLPESRLIFTAATKMFQFAVLLYMWVSPIGNPNVRTKYIQLGF